MKVGFISFVTIGFIFLLFVCLTNSAENPTLDRNSAKNPTLDRNSAENPTLDRRSITPTSDSSKDGLLKGGKNDESEEEEKTSSFPDDEKEGEVNGEESEEEESEEEDEEGDGDVEDTSSSSSSTGTEEEEEEGSSSENTDIGSSSDISSTSKKDGKEEASRNGGEGNTSSNSKSSLLDEKKSSLRSSSSNDGRKGRNKKHSSSPLTNCSTDHLDLCSQPLLFYGDPSMNNLPETPLQVGKKCNDWRSSVKCSRDWSKKCLMDGTTAKLLVESMITGPSKNIRERCSYDGTVWFLRSQRCTGTIRAEIETCLERLKNGLSSILLETTTLKNQDWESSGCCLFQQFNSCFEKNLNESCSETGEEGSVKYARRVYEANFGSFMNNFCAKKEVISSGTPSISSTSPSNSFSSSSSSSSFSKKCEGLISKLSQITNPSSTGSSSSSSIIIVHGNESEKRKGTRSDSMEGEESETMIKKLMMSQREEKTRISSSLLVTVIKLYQKFGLISSQDFVPSSS